MNRFVSRVFVGLSVLAFVGCSATEADSPNRSRTVATDSPEYQRSKGEQDQFEQEAKEAERKALGTPIE
jgi:hypothetical protein